MRNSTRARRPCRPGGCGHRLHPGPLPRIETGKSESADSRRRSGRDRCGIQHPACRGSFALEEVVGDLNAPVLGSVVLASATSWGMLRLLLGNDPLFQVPQYQLVHPGELGIYAVLGVAGGLVSVAFTKLLVWMRACFLRFPRKTVWFQPVA